MKKLYTFVLSFVFLSFFLVPLSPATAQTLAFPGAEGFGKYATGGRTGTVYHVTNLNNTGTGSLRDAVSAPNRIVVFDVGGVIKIVDRIVVAANIYIAGQTAPGEGITVYGNGWSFSNANNTICRYLKIRMGAVGTSGKDACGIAEGHDMIFDHCSVSWGRDETFSVNAPTAQNITIQNTIMSQGILVHSAGGLIQTNGGVTLYRNLYADNGTRNNKIKGVNQYVNNIVYNWDAGAYIMGGDSEGESFANAVGNCFIQGPVTGARPFSVGNSLYHLYATDNIHDSNRNGLFDAYQLQQSEFGGGPDFQNTPYNYPIVPTIAANSLISQSLPTVGACLPYRDLVDYYVTNEVKSFGKMGTFISNENELPFGIPTAWTLWAGTIRTDTDHDGIPDAWETANGLNANSASDAMIITANGYTNIENYINSITADYSQYFLRAPLNLKQDSSTQNSVSFSWLDYTDKEKGYIIEKKINGVFTAVDSTDKNENFYTTTGMQPDQRDTFRVKAYDSLSTSAYSNILAVKSKPVPVVVLDPATFAPDLVWTGAGNMNWDKTSANWMRNNVAAPFTDSSTALFSTGTGPQTIQLMGAEGIKNVLIQSDSDYNFVGTGSITGTGSVNKTGTGKLALLNDNSYTGATVLWNGTLEINKLANGGLPSSIGASSNYPFNWVWKGGKIKYTGADASTDRSVTLDGTTEFSVDSSTATVTVAGVLSGSGGLVKSGPGKLLLKSVNPYEGETVIKGGTIEVVGSAIIDGGKALGTSNVLKLQGGTYRTTVGSTTVYENYPMDMIVADGTFNGFEPFRNCNINSTVSGNGTLTYAITYSRELIQGDWSQFSGTLIANGVGTLTGAERSMLMFNNADGIPNARIVTAGNTKIACWKNAVTMHLGGLSGPAGTSLSGGNKTAGGSMTWVVGGAGTDETFNGVINNEAYSSGNGTTTIVKEGSGSWRLTGANVYSGTTTINGGSFIVNGAHTGTGKITVTEGTLAGKGSLTGDVEVQSGAMLQPGDSSISKFTLKGKLTLLAGSITDVDINKTTSSRDTIAVTGVIAFGGTLKINMTGTPAVGDVYKLFSMGATPATGTFSDFIPATPGAGLIWSFSPATGELSVVSGILPVNLTKYTAIAENNRTKLEWATSYEMNNDHYEIEHSTDGMVYKLLRSVKGNGHSNTPVSYTAYDFSPANGMNYYRLKQYDLDGRQTVYGIRTVDFTKKGDASLQIYPNPVISNFAIRLPAFTNGTLNVTITTMDGKMIEQRKLTGNSTGIYNIALAKKLPTGEYMLTVTNDNLHQRTPLFVQ